MATRKITITLPEELVDAARGLTDNLSGYAAEALAAKIRHELLGEELAHALAGAGLDLGVDGGPWVRVLHAASDVGAQLATLRSFSGAPHTSHGPLGFAL